MLASTIILLVIFITNQSLQFLQRAAMGQVPATELLHLIALQIPLLLGYLLPLGLYLGVLLTITRFYLSSEITVLSACGVSQAQLTRMIFTIALFVAIIVAWLMAVVVPKAQGDINEIINKGAATASAEQVIPGRFIVFGKKDNSVVFYASRVENHSVLHGVFLAKEIKATDNTHPAKWDIIVAKIASEKKVPGQAGRYLIFDNGYRYSGTPGEKNYHVLQFKKYEARLFFGQPPRPNAAQYYSITKLWSLSPQNKDAAAELQWRLAMPISTLVFALLAIPLCVVRPRYGKFTHMLPAILIYMGYGDLIFLTRSWISAGEISPALGMWWVHGSALALTILLMLYRVGWYRIRHLFSRGAPA